MGVFAVRAQYNPKLSKGRPDVKMPIYSIILKRTYFENDACQMCVRKVEFSGQTLTRLYRPTLTKGIINELQVSYGTEKTVQGFGYTNRTIPFYMYSRKYDAFYEALGRQKE